jgi:class 3 adenylate cyclase
VKCPSCQRENAADASFCAQCGRRLGITCPACGRPASADAVFCTGCGVRVNAPQATAPPPPVAPPEHLAEKVRASRTTLEGERKQVTVLFADVAGSIDLQEDLDPEEWHGVMDRFMRILADGVHRFEGTVDKFTGDGIMALFGAPVAYEDHARRACYAALHLADAIGRYAEELRRTKGLSFHARMGLNSGEVIVGAIGDDSHMEYTAVGHTVGLAQRMEALAAPGRAYLTEHTARLAQGYFRLRDLGPFAPCGPRPGSMPGRRSPPTSPRRAPPSRRREPTPGRPLSMRSAPNWPASRGTAPPGNASCARLTDCSWQSGPAGTPPA